MRESAPTSRRAGKSGGGRRQRARRGRVRRDEGLDEAECVAIARALTEQHEMHLRRLAALGDGRALAHAREAAAQVRAMVQAFETAAARETDSDRMTTLELGLGGARRMLILLEQLVTTWSLERGVENVRLVSVDVARVVEGALQDARAYAEARGIGLVARIDAACVPYLHADESLLRRALAAMLTHAVSVSPSGAWVSLTAVRDAGRVRFGTEDRGPALSDDQAANFFCASAARVRHEARRGVGAALPFIRAVARAHGASVRAWTGDAGTTHVELLLPDSAPTKEAIALSQPRRMASSSRGASEAGADAVQGNGTAWTEHGSA